eukprot:31314-Pelagococcus_subviridis.AAC.38
MPRVRGSATAPRSAKRTNESDGIAASVRSRRRRRLPACSARGRGHDELPPPRVGVVSRCVCVLCGPRADASRKLFSTIARGLSSETTAQRATRAIAIRVL